MLISTAANSCTLLLTACTVMSSHLITTTEADVQKGFVICDEAHPCRASTTLLCQVALVELTEQRPIFSSGYECIFHCHTCEEVSGCCLSTDSCTAYSYTNGTVMFMTRLCCVMCSFVATGGIAVYKETASGN
jgi:hypothetical protein